MKYSDLLFKHVLFCSKINMVKTVLHQAEFGKQFKFLQTAHLRSKVTVTEGNVLRHYLGISAHILLLPS